MKNYFLIACIFCIAASCTYDQLDRTIFIPDENDPSLPAYTEWGYNAFGAIYERNYFLSTYNFVPCKIVYKNDSLHFSLHGNLQREEMILTFSFPSPPRNSYTDLITLNKTEFDLSNTVCRIKMNRGYGTELLSPYSGHLVFKRAQFLRVDGEANRIILSGIFDLEFLRNDLPERITNGRFDLGINEDFYSFP